MAPWLCLSGRTSLNQGLRIQMKDSNRPSQMQDSLGSHLAVLAVQPEMGVSEFCTFVGGFLPSVRTMRFVRQDNTSQGDCLVLLQFESDARAAQFYKQHNNQPVSFLCSSSKSALK
jgi:hypothetical protein